MTDRELMQTALEAMEHLHRTGDTQVFDMYAAPEIITALRERLAQPEQEPVSMYEDWYDSNSCSHCGMVGGHAKSCRHYTTPPAAQRQPLTDEKIWNLWNSCGVDEMNQQEAFAFARAIEAAHGIKEKNNG